MAGSQARVANVYGVLGMKNASKGLVALLVMSLGVNATFYFVGIHPVLIKKLHVDEYLQNVGVDEYRGRVLDGALAMAASDEVLMPFGDNEHFLRELKKLIDARERAIYFSYSFPKAYLMNGLLEYAASINDKRLIDEVTGIFADYHGADGRLSFELNKVDQAPFGLTFIALHELHGDAKYKNGADQICMYLKSHIEKNGLILYRDGDDRQFVDVLGMVVPFLVRYGVAYNDNDALRIAYAQLNYYIENGLEQNSGFPFHGINIKSRLRLGPANWGRGIGWYALALAYALHYTNTGDNPYIDVFRREMDRIHDRLMGLRSEGHWGQFVSGGNGVEIDTSTTTMLLRAFQLAGNEKPSESLLASLFAAYTTIDGYLDFTSGDTYSINRYAVEHGKSELSQGVLLSLLAEAQ